MTKQEINDRVAMIRTTDTLSSATFYFTNILKEACKEQRKLCSDQIGLRNTEQKSTKELVLDAPEPKFDQ